MQHQPGPSRPLQEAMPVETWELCHPENKVFDSTDNCRIRKGHLSGPFSKRLEHRLRQNLKNFNTTTKRTFEKLGDLDGNPNATPTPIAGLEDYLNALDRDKAQFLADLTGQPGEDENAEPPHCRFEVTIPGGDDKPARTISWSTADEYDDAVLVKLLLTLQLKRKSPFDITVSGPPTLEVAAQPSPHVSGPPTPEVAGRPASEAEDFSEDDDDAHDDPSYNPHPHTQSRHAWNEAPRSKVTIAVSPSTWNKEDEQDQNAQPEKASPKSHDGHEDPYQLRLESGTPSYGQEDDAAQPPVILQGQAGTAPHSIPYDDLPFKCTLPGCDRAFRSACSLKKHVTLLHHRRRSSVPAWDKPRMATGGKSVTKNHACQVQGCTKRYATRAQLAAHAHTHTGEKPFSCRDCGQQFQQKGGLLKHREVHKEVHTRPFQCKQCDSSFYSKKSYGIHMKNAHGRHHGGEVQ